MRSAKPGAVVEITDATGRVTSYHSFTCCHCGNPKTVTGRIEDVADICRSCWHLHCLEPECLQCIPFKRKVDAVEARDESLRSMGLL